MGNKSNRKRKYILFYIAIGCIIAAVNIAGCIPVQETPVQRETHQQLLELYRKNLADGFFQTVIQEGRHVVEEDDTEPPADIALYALGEVYLHHDYEGRSYVLSQYYFEKLIKNFPDSPLTSEAKMYINLLETISANEKIAADLQKQETMRKKLPVHKEKENALVIAPRRVVENQNFEEAVKENMQILDKVGKEKPADLALYNLGLIYAHVDNPGKDYKKSKGYFHLLVRQFPESEFAEEAQIWLGLFDTIEEIQLIDIEIDQQKKQLIR